MNIDHQVNTIIINHICRENSWYWTAQLQKAHHINNAESHSCGDLYGEITSGYLRYLRRETSGDTSK